MSDESPVFEKIPVRAGDLFTFRADRIAAFQGIEVVPHYHMMHELMWFRASTGSYTLGSEKFAIENNTLIFVPALMIHEMSIPEEENHSRYLLQFEKEWLDEYALASDTLQCGAVARWRRWRETMPIAWTCSLTGVANLMILPTRFFAR